MLWSNVGRGVLVSAACGGVLAFFPFALAHAALTSTSYVIESPSIGTPSGFGMSSTNYSLSPSTGSSYTTSDTVPPPSQPGGGSGTQVKKRPNIQPVIAATTKLENIDGLPEIHAQGPVLTQNDEGKVTQLEKSEDAKAGATKNSDVSEGAASTTLPYSFANVASVLGSNFTHFPARAVTAIWIISFLLYIRSFTNIGRKYRPF